jgi:hypothetical protein
MNKGIIGFFLILLIVSCDKHIDPEEMLKNENVFKLTIHTINKEESTYNTVTDTIYKDSEKISKLRIWLTDNSTNWENSIASYAMSDISLIGNDFRFLIFKTGVVIGFTDSSGKLKQFTKKVDKSVFNFLVENY